jgi:prefoldin subunit 4
MQLTLLPLQLQKKIDELGDAEEGVMMADESVPGAVKLMIGEVFVDIDGTAATDYIQGELNKANATKSSLESSLKQVEARMAELKATLYARFGKSINLDE